MEGSTRVGEDVIFEYYLQLLEGDSVQEVSTEQLKKIKY